jgi:hypothetical protein
LKVASFIVRALSVLPVAAPSGPGRWLLFALAVAAVVVLHALLLLAVAPAGIDAADEAPAALPALVVRSVTTVPAPAVAAPALPAAATAAPDPAPVPPPKVRPAPVSRPAVVASPPLPLPATAAPSVEAAAVAADPVAAPAIDVPVYATRLSAAGRWRYRLMRGAASGEALLAWHPDDARQRYELRLEGSVAGVAALDWISTGAIDAAGIAPERFAIRRRGRDSQAANFQREEGKVTWSGPTHEVPIVPGVQDRLTWMLQLPAVIDAAPQRFAPGASVVLMVIGARGGADVWTFDVVGPEAVGDTPALKLRRTARKLRDVTIEVWLDPARGHLPLRALQTQADGGAPLELLLEPGGSTGP